MNTREVVVGDWVMFYRGGRLVIGVVRYVQPRNPWEQSDTLCTDVGEVKADAVLEVRGGA